MDKPISVGDLVVVVKLKPCCGRGTPGAIFRVKKILRGPAECTQCGERYTDSLDVQTDGDDWVQMFRVKLIPPLADLEGLESEEVDKLPSPRMVEAAKRYKRLVTSK